LNAIHPERAWAPDEPESELLISLEDPSLRRRLDEAVCRARDGLLSLQHPDGHWSFEFEADCTIPAEYILMMHYMDDIDEELQAKISVYLREHQGADGGWPLYLGGEMDMSATVKVYYALKLAGDDPDAPHMRRAREAILARGGAATCNVFTRITLALFGQVPWRATPILPVELMLLPRWFPFHLSKVSYWSRTVTVPLAILCSHKPKARNPRGIGIRELFTVDPEEERNYFPIRSRLNQALLVLERAARRLEPLMPRWIRRKATEKAEGWFVQRLGEGGLGAIFPAMVNAYEALDLLGYPPEHPHRQRARKSIDDLLVIRDRDAYCQPCVSPVWDTGIACMALIEAGDEQSLAAARKGFDWLKERQLLDEPGDWREYRPELPGGGWPFQYENKYYPDLDDTGMVAWAMDAFDSQAYDETIRRATVWIHGMQSKNGGFASFDADNTYYYLNEIPFADHGALLDPPTEDVTGRCLALLARRRKDDGRYTQAIVRAIDYLRDSQRSDGAWFGRWGTNYIYGTWSVLAALEQAGVPSDDPAIRRAVDWLEGCQHEDGGWGEDNDSYTDPDLAGQFHQSTSYQTAWAILGLMASDEQDSAAVRAGVQYLLRSQQADGLWSDPWFNAPGFPRVFYLIYHGYKAYFPFWALARFRKLLMP
jgi:squalene-hopene/tetraprenyl-beta-curcumene cyclase